MKDWQRRGVSVGSASVPSSRVPYVWLYQRRYLYQPLPFFLIWFSCFGFFTYGITITSKLLLKESLLKEKKVSCKGVKLSVQFNVE